MLGGLSGERYISINLLYWILTLVASSLNCQCPNSPVSISHWAILIDEDSGSRMPQSSGHTKTLHTALRNDQFPVHQRIKWSNRHLHIAVMQAYESYEPFEPQIEAELMKLASNGYRQYPVSSIILHCKVYRNTLEFNRPAEYTQSTLHRKNSELEK